MRKHSIGTGPVPLSCAVVYAIAMLSLSPAAHAADAGAGLALAEQWCNACHSIGAEEPRQEDAGPLWSDLAKKDDAYLQGALNRPHDFMPDFPSLSEVDKLDLVAYIQSLGDA